MLITAQALDVDARDVVERAFREHLALLADSDHVPALTDETAPFVNYKDGHV
jgi:hypothetical protein